MKRNSRYLLIPIVVLMLMLYAVRLHAQPDPDGAFPDLTGQFSLYLPFLFGSEAPNSTPENAAGNHRRLSDPQDFISVEAPVGWDEIDSGVWPQEGAAQGVFVTAAPDLEAFEAGDGPGLLYIVTRNMDSARPSEVEPANSIRSALASAATAAADAAAAAGCSSEITDYADAFYAGLMTKPGMCAAAAEQQTSVYVHAMPLTGQFVVQLRIAAAGDGAQATIQQALDTFQVLQPSLNDPHHAAEDAEESVHQH